MGEAKRRDAAYNAAYNAGGLAMAHALRTVFESIQSQIDMVSVDQVVAMIGEAAAVVASQGPPGTQLH